MGFRESAIRLLGTVNTTGFVAVALILFLLDTGITYFIIQRVAYTEIDWSTYMQQVECFLNKRIYNYSLIEGDTGPVVYPAGHIFVYSWLYSFTNGGKDIRTGQLIFMGIYLLNLLLVFRLYFKSNKIVPIVLPFLVITGYRIHSIFVLRLFNDPIAIFFFYLAANFFISQWWLFGCIFYSLAVSIKMNVLLFAPALFFVLLLNNGFWWTVSYLTVCAVLQIYMGLPFLLYDPVAYMKRSFDLGRVFLYEWTVNWRFLPESLFLNPKFHLLLLVAHIIALFIFGYHMWFRSHGGLKASLLELLHGIRTRTGVAETLFALFTANLIGITFSRSLHYQFYSWYFHQLPFLLFWNSGDILTLNQLLRMLAKGTLLLVVEYSWNTFPSTPLSSILLHLCHASLLVYLILTRVERYKRKFKVT